MEVLHLLKNQMEFQREWMQVGLFIFALLLFIHLTRPQNYTTLISSKSKTTREPIFLLGVIRIEVTQHLPQLTSHVGEFLRLVSSGLRNVLWTHWTDMYIVSYCCVMFV